MERDSENRAQSSGNKCNKGEKNQKAYEEINPVIHAAEVSVIKAVYPQMKQNYKRKKKKTIGVLTYFIVQS